MNQGKRFDLSFSGFSSLVAWQLACFLLRLMILPKAVDHLKPEPQRNMKEARQLPHWQACTACEGGYVYEKESGGVATTSAVITNKQTCEEEGRSSVSRPDSSLLQVASFTSGVLTATEETGSVQLSFCTLWFVNCAKIPASPVTVKQPVLYDKQISCSSSPPLTCSTCPQDSAEE